MKILKLTIGKRLALGFGLLLAILLSAVMYASSRLNELQRVENELVSSTILPLAASELVGEINKSLAILRGYLVLGTPILKKQRQQVWDNIDAQMAVLKSNKTSTLSIIGYAEKLRALEVSLKQYRSAQDEAEAVAHTDAEQPAQAMYQDKVQPVVIRLLAAINQLTTVEQGLPATPERKELLGLFANASASLSLGLAATRSYLINGDKTFKATFASQWTVNTSNYYNIGQKRYLLNSEQEKLFNEYTTYRDKFAGMVDQLFAIRESKRWNMSQYLLGTKAAPLSVLSLQLVDEVSALQRNQLNREVGKLNALNDDISNVLKITGIGSLVVGFLVAFIITRSVTRPVLAMTKTLKKVSRNGDYSERLEVTGRDEISESALAFNRLMDETQSALSELNKVMGRIAEGDLSTRINGEYKGDLNAIKEVTNRSLDNAERAEQIKQEFEAEAAAVADENARVRQALDSVSNNIMLANSELDVIYINNATRTMLVETADDFAKEIPGFNPKNVVGNSIDAFHRDPSRQRKILENLTTQFTSEFFVGDKVMSITAMPIFNNDGERLGVVIEWTDRTAEVAIEREIDA